MRGSMTTPRMMPAAVKRTPTIHAGGNASTVDLMTTVPRPQMAAATSKKALYVQSGSGAGVFRIRAIAAASYHGCP